jgi:hypothetical protein
MRHPLAFTALASAAVLALTSLPSNAFLPFEHPWPDSMVQSVQAEKKEPAKKDAPPQKKGQEALRTQAPQVEARCLPSPRSLARL